MATYAPVAYTTAASNTQIDFDITFTFLRATDVVVSVIDPNGNVLVNGTDYDAELQAVNDGTFDMRVVQAGTLNTTRDPLAANHVVSIKRNTDISQIVTVFQDGASFKAADINAIITQLFNKIQEVEVSSGEGIGLTDDLVAFDAENKPLRNLGTPTADNDAMRKVDIDSGIGPDITTVAGIAAAVSSVAADTADIGVVATNITGTDTIGTVSSNIADVNTVATDIANVNTVAADTADIGTVAADIQVGGPDTIGTVANAIGDVGIVAGINGQVLTVAGAIANVNTVAADTADIGTVATNIADVNTVATDIANVNTVAGQSANITTITQPANLTAIQNAATNAAAAEAALNAFNATYVGAYASDPSVDANGNALTDGDLYYDTTNQRLKFYDAANGVWITLANSVQVNSAATLQAVGDVDFANAGGPALALAANHFIVRDATNARWENTDAAGVRTLLNVEDGADVTDATNVQSAGALMDSELSNEAAVKAIDQGLATTNTPTFAGADFGSNAITYSNVYSQLSDLQNVDAATYHGMFAHVHATGKGYFAHAGNWQALQNEVTNSTALAAASLTTVTDAGNTVDVRRADRIAQGSNVNVDGGATLYDVTATAELTLSDLVAGDIVTIFSRSGTTTIARGTITYAYIDGDIATNKTSVTVGAGTLATVTMVSDDTAIIAGSDLT